MRRKRIYLIVLLAGLASVGYWWVRSVAGYHISPDTVVRIRQQGMTADAAKMAIGWRPSREGPLGRLLPDGKPINVETCWNGTNGTLLVRSDAEGTVVWVQFTSKPDQGWVLLWNKLGLPHIDP